MNIFKNFMIFSKITLRNIRFLFLIIGYFLICSLRWQPWLENSSLNFLNDTFSWTSWVVTILPAFFLLYRTYIYWLGSLFTYVRVQKSRIYLQYFRFFTYICSFVISVLYGIFAYLPYSYTYFYNSRNLLLFFKNELFLFIFLNLYGLLFCILRYLGFKHQLIPPILLILPALDQVLFFSFQITLSQNAIFLNTNLHSAFYYLIPLSIFYLLLNQILYWLIDHYHVMEIRYDKF